MEKELKFIGFLLLGFCIGYLISSVVYQRDTGIDIDCLVNYFEQNKIDDISLGYVHETASVEKIREMYVWKLPKSRFLVEFKIKQILLGCKQ